MRFGSFTTLGAAVWVAILTGVGYQLGVHSRELSYAELVYRGTELVTEHMLWIVLGCAALLAGWLYVHRKLMHGPTRARASANSGES
jgi:membrane protein DedA with SNARE-associated domain